MASAVGDTRAKELIDLGNKLYTQKEPINRLCQEIAENVYLERADFTSPQNFGLDFAGSTMDSVPALLRQELGDQMSAILRPKARDWFASTTLDDELDNNPTNARYLEHITGVVRRSLYDPRTKFIRATKETDHGFITFGQWVMSVEESNDRDHLFYRSFHLRDCAWLENEIGDIDHLHRKDKMTARVMKRKFSQGMIHQSVSDACEKEPHKEFNLRVIIMPADEYDYMTGGTGTAGSAYDEAGNRLPFIAIYVDADNTKIMKEAPLAHFLYVVPRWHTLSGSPYAFSPAAMTSLPDARLAQDLARIILESGEKAIDPPAVARVEAIREGNIQAGGITWADIQGDQRLDDAFKLLEFRGDMKVGFAMRQDLRETLARAWFIDKLKLPEAGQEMTAYEVSQRLEEHVRNLLPLFEPMEVEYNTKVLDLSFNHLRNMGRFPVDDIPDDLSGADITWSFRNPMQEASSRILVQQFQEALQIEQAAAELGGVKVRRINLSKARDDAVRGAGGPADWRYSDEEMEEMEEAAELEAQTAAALQQASAAATVGQQVGDAAQSLEQGSIPAPMLPKPKSNALIPSRGAPT